MDNLASSALQSLGVRSWFVEWRAHFGTTAKAQPLTAPVWFGADKHFPPFTWQGWIGSTDKVPGTRSSVSCARDKTRSQNTLAQEKRLLWCVPVGRASWLACAYELGYKLHWFRKEKVHTFCSPRALFSYSAAVQASVALYIFNTCCFLLQYCFILFQSGRDHGSVLGLIFTFHSDSINSYWEFRESPSTTRTW